MEKIKKILVVVLWLTAIHSFIVGICLIFMPASFLPFFGFDVYFGNFFRAQGGVFHIIMSIIYGLAAIDIDKSRNLIIVTVTAKLIATLFLFIYFFAVNSIWSVLFSGITDGLIGIAIFIIFSGYLKKQNMQKITL